MKKECKIHSLYAKSLTNVVYDKQDDIFMYGCFPLIATVCDYQHLYITSDEEIKNGDWYIVLTRDMLEVKRALIDIGKGPNHRKIIATTDTNLRVRVVGCTVETKPLPQIPDSFIKEYCDEGGIDTVLIEHDYLEKCLYEIPIECENSHCRVFNKCIEEPQLKRTTKTLKLNSDNTIIISPLAEKMYTEKLLLKALLSNDLIHSKEEALDWIKENI